MLTTMIDTLPTLPFSVAVPLLQQWAREDATDDPATIAQAERELAQLKAALNANRPPDKPVFL